MEQIVRLVAERAGISEDAAQTAVQTVLTFVEDKLPGPVAEQIKAALEGGVDADVAQQALGALGGLFGKS